MMKTTKTFKGGIAHRETTQSKVTMVPPTTGMALAKLEITVAPLTLIIKEGLNTKERERIYIYVSCKEESNNLFYILAFKLENGYRSFPVND